jgi:hypothetical protein
MAKITSGTQSHPGRHVGCLGEFIGIRTQGVRREKSSSAHALGKINQMIGG